MLTELAAALRRGPVVVPTDTVFGIACLPEPDALEAVFAAKQRPLDRNLPVIIGDVVQLDALGVLVTPAGEALMADFWPGGLTIVFGFSSTKARPDFLGGRDEVAVRMPAVDALRDLARAVGPFLMTSANRHGEPDATTRDEAIAIFGLTFPVFDFDRPPVPSRPSTLVNVKIDPPVVQRIGAIAMADIHRVCPDAVAVDG